MVVLITGFGALDTTVAASREGVWDIISKPFKVQEIIAVARRALERSEESGKGDRRRPKPIARNMSEAGMAGLIERSPAMLELYKEIARVAGPFDGLDHRRVWHGQGVGGALDSSTQRPRLAPVRAGQLRGAHRNAARSGTLRPRARRLYGAVADHKGLWEEAEGGTLFLDEIGETSPALQVKLLRALQEGEIRRVGASRSVRVDARVVAATNCDLEKEVAAGRFREDLFYRLNVFTLRPPTLRERSDIRFLAERFLRASRDNVGRPLSF